VPEPSHTEPRAGDVRHTHADIGAARDALAFEAAVGFDAGLARTVAAFDAGGRRPKSH
jgi:UDP-glucose 4-epimerase